MLWCLVRATCHPDHKYDGNNLSRIVFRYGVVFDNNHNISDLDSSYRRYDSRSGSSVSSKAAEGAVRNDSMTTNGNLTCRTIEDDCGQKGKHYAYNIRKYGSDEAANHIFSFVATQSTSPNIQFTFTKMD